jgi:hypothetical protein
MRALAALGDVHRTAEHDEAAIAIELRSRVGLALEVDELDAMATPPDQAIERAERFGGDVLEDEDAGHARESDSDESELE